MRLCIKKRHIPLLVMSGLMAMLLYLVFTGEREERYLKEMLGLPSGNKDVGRDAFRGKSVRTSGITPLVHMNFSSMSLPEVKEYIARYNEMQPVQNAGKFPFDKGSTGVVFLIQVHTRFEELQLLLRTLENVKDIHTCLLVFSHDVVNDTFNQYIAGITFAPLLQIFFPFSTQLYADVFPGTHPNDCSRDEAVAAAQARGCNNAEHPDGHGHYRESRVTQMKHHWLWMLRFTFENVRQLRDFRGVVVQLDDDCYVVEDTVHVLRKSAALMSRDCADCMVVLAAPFWVPPEVNGHAGQQRASILFKKAWRTGSCVGLSLTSYIWHQLLGCVQTFCSVDDYNWDWALLYTAHTCFDNRFLKVLQPTLGRVHHVGVCRGTHVVNADDKVCTLDMVQRQIESTLRTEQLFPENLTVVEVPFEKSLDRYTPWGGWTDPRDVALCQSLVRNDSDVDLVRIQSILQQQRVGDNVII